MAFTRWISIILVKRKKNKTKNLLFHSILKIGNKYSFTLGLWNPVCTEAKTHTVSLQGRHFPPIANSPFIADIGTRLPHGQVNQEGLDNSWENFNVFISSLFLLKVCEKRNLINNKRGNNSVPRPEANGVNASVNKVKLFSLLKGQK